MTTKSSPLLPHTSYMDQTGCLKKPFGCISNMLDVHGCGESVQITPIPAEVLQHFPALFPGTHTHNQ